MKFVLIFAGLAVVTWSAAAFVVTMRDRVETLQRLEQSYLDSRMDRRVHHTLRAMRDHTLPIKTETE